MFDEGAAVLYIRKLARGDGAEIVNVRSTSLALSTPGCETWGEFFWGAFFAGRRGMSRASGGALSELVKRNITF